MFGWEFPPFSKGGLGVACYGITKGLAQNGVEVIMVLPKAPCTVESPFSRVLIASELYRDTKYLRYRHIDTLLAPYMDEEEYRKELMKYAILKKGDKFELYGKDIYQEIYRYAIKARLIAMAEEFDIIHAHDWMTFPAAIEAKKISKKPLVIHIHATEFDRTGGHPNQYVYDIERRGMHEADAVFCVSNFTRNLVLEHYGIDPAKVFVTYNSIDNEGVNMDEPFRIEHGDKVVLFLGRITLQKGPDYFIYAAKKVLEFEPNTKFIIAGSGDMQAKIIEKAAELGISKNVLFAGFLTGDDIDRAYRMADLYVMPSVSEPFGLTPLEAMRNGTPVLISKQSGVSEVIKNCLKVDFWDIDEMANKIVAVLRYPSLQHTLKVEGLYEISRFSWHEAAKRYIELYNKLVSKKR